MSHVREARPETVVVGSKERVGALEIDVITESNQRSFGILQINTTSGIGQDHGFDAHSCENTNRKRDFFGSVTFVEMHAALHPCDGNIPDVSDNQLSSVPDGGRLRKVRNLLVWDFRRATKFIGKGAQAGTQNQSDAGTEFGFTQNKLGGARGAGEFSDGDLGRHVGSNLAQEAERRK